MGRYALAGGIPTQANLPDQLRAKVTRRALPRARCSNRTISTGTVFSVLRDRWPGKLVLKGILHPADAERALALGADGVVVSNHGGRALD